MVTLDAVDPVPVSVSGQPTVSVTGQGQLAFYAPATTNLGVSGNWDNYTASLSGNVTLQLTSDALTLNGTPLPAGTYTITTSSATLAGSGPSTSPNFAGSASITATGGTVDLGPGTGNIAVGGNPLDPTNGVTLTGYTGTINVSANGDGTDSVTLNGNAANVLQVSGSPATLTTDQNTPVTFQTNVQTSFADTYTLTAQAPPGWTVTIDNNGKVTATPAPGLQGGTFPIQIIAQSKTNPDLVAQSVVNVTITPTQPGITLAVQPDTLFTVPFQGAQLPTAFQAVIHNNGPAADTYNLSFSNIPSGFTLLNSGTTVTIPAGQTGIVGIYLVPTTGQIPPPGTPASFTVTATSTTNPAITSTQTESFTVPEIYGVTQISPPAVAEQHSRRPGHGHHHAARCGQRAGERHAGGHAAAGPDGERPEPGVTPAGPVHDGDDHADSRRHDAAQQHAHRDGDRDLRPIGIAADPDVSDPRAGRRPRRPGDRERGRGRGAARQHRSGRQVQRPQHRAHQPGAEPDERGVPEPGPGEPCRGCWPARGRSLPRRARADSDRRWQCSGRKPRRPAQCRPPFPIWATTSLPWGQP